MTEHDHGHGHSHGHDHGHSHGSTAAAPSQPAQTGIGITDKAAEKLKDFLAQEGKGPEVGLRLGVTGGGCSGLSYMMDFDSKKDDDKVYTHPNGVKILVDPRSHLYINGSVLDYQESLMGSGFTIKNPQVKGSCGCGQSFNV